MKKFFQIMACLMLFVTTFSANAQSNPFKGKFSGVYEGRECTLNIDLYAPTISSYGMIGIDPVTKQLKTFKELTEIKCLGTLELYFGGFVTYNILSFDDGTDMEGGAPAYFIMVQQYDNNMEDAINVMIDSKGGKIILNDGRDVDDPLMTNLTLKRIH